MDFDGLVNILCDNTNAINISKNGKMHSIMNHISIKYQVLIEKAANQEVKLEYVPTKD